MQGKARHPHLPAGASSPGSSKAPSLLRKTAAHGHGRGGRKRNRGNLARGATYGAKTPGRVWAQSPSPGCFRQRGSQAAGHPGLESPTLAIWRSAQVHFDDIGGSRVLSLAA